MNSGITGASWWVEKASEVVTRSRPCGVPRWTEICSSMVSIALTIRRAAS